VQCTTAERAIIISTADWFFFFALWCRSFHPTHPNKNPPRLFTNGSPCSPFDPRTPFSPGDPLSPFAPGDPFSPRGPGISIASFNCFCSSTICWDCFFRLVYNIDTCFSRPSMRSWRCSNWALCASSSLSLKRGVEGGGRGRDGRDDDDVVVDEGEGFNALARRRG